MSYMLLSSHALQIINLQDFIGATQDLLYKMVLKIELMRLIGTKIKLHLCVNHDLTV